LNEDQITTSTKLEQLIYLHPENQFGFDGSKASAQVLLNVSKSPCLMSTSFINIMSGSENQRGGNMSNLVLLYH